ncbi:MAG: glycoside hydrolase family 15 protein [Actinomycetota bacterium]
MNEPRISDYALLGDTRTAALVSRDGSIDWMCAPGFDSAPVFGKVVGGDQGGSFRLAVDGTLALRRRYVGDSAVLDTEIEASGGRGSLHEAMPVQVEGSLLPQSALVRRLTCERGTLNARICFDPKQGLPGRAPRVSRRHRALVCEWGALALTLQSFPHVEISPGEEISVEVPAGSDLVLVLAIGDRAPAVFVSHAEARALPGRALGWWNRWSEDVRYRGPSRDQVVRSLVTLQLLTFSPSGAPVAAPTTSLPEEVGGGRNWDYRFSWPRDASIGLAAFLALGKPEIAHSFMHWLLHASRLSRPRLKVLYTLYGNPPPREREVDGVPGYRGSLPVRVGNEARVQHQLDVYGWVVDAAWLLTDAGHDLHAEHWRAVGGFADFAAGAWREPDAGIWEVRGEPRHYVHSKMMAWLCLDRALRIAQRRSVSSRRTARWATEKERLRDDVIARGFDPNLGSYVRSYESRDLDAALLILPVLQFDDRPERVQGTIAAIRRELGAGDGLLYRYRVGDDGLHGREGAFLPCSFWLVQALARTGRRAEAAELFDNLVARANDVGLFSEEIDPTSGELLGNFPQAFTHATLVQAATSLSGED